MDILDTFTKSPVPILLNRVKDAVAKFKTKSKILKKTSDIEKEQILECILAQEELADPTGDVITLVRGSIVSSDLIACITSQQDSRALFVIQKIDPATCERLQDIPEE